MTPLAQLWSEVTGAAFDEEAVAITGAETVLPGPFRVALAAGTAVAATTMAAASLLQARGREPGTVRVDLAHAAEAFRSERHLRVDGAPLPMWGPLSGDYAAADGWVRLHANYPHHAEAIAAALGVAADKEAVADAVAGRAAEEVEYDVVAAGGAAAAMRGRTQWQAHAQGKALRAEPLIMIDRVADAAPRRLDHASWPLTGVKVLDLTHVIAGPVCGRVLAAHGADVLHVSAANRPTVRPLVVDTGFGKRSVHLDLSTESGAEQLRELVRGADVFLQSYRPGALARLGFGMEELAALRPGIIGVDLSAYGHTGPWASRRGFDSLVQMSCGIAAEGAVAAGADEPTPLPAQALDHGTGWLAAFAVISVLQRRGLLGGSWQVRLSLARTALWLDQLGRIDVAPTGSPDLTGLLADVDSAFGTVTHVRVPGSLPGAPAFYRHGPHLPGSDDPNW
ncbi:CoA transferase [Labedaea rhizosphaerae]|uniref:CoA transferase family III n=1 Tax=Labedaea rhizosphaerae TaxID=598644 RepID=A0A4R6RYB1_LABRH|nr:CoA transferase [Labedaea rhizosphaerae]TDP92101.1 CoA transferase family III [Labedaea rhizosphaerae]